MSRSSSTGQRLWEAVFWNIIWPPYKWRNVLIFLSNASNPIWPLPNYRKSGDAFREEIAAAISLALGRSINSLEWVLVNLSIEIRHFLLSPCPVRSRSLPRYLSQLSLMPIVDDITSKCYEGALEINVYNPLKRKSSFSPFHHTIGQFQKYK